MLLARPRTPASAIARHPGPALVVAACLWAGGGLIARGAPLAGPQLAFWRCVLGASVYGTVLAARQGRLRWSDLRSAALGGAGFGLSIVFLFVAFKTTTLVSALVIGSLQPLVLGIIDQRRGRRLGGVLWAATAVAVAGTVLVVVGSSAHTGTWSLRGDLFAAAGMAANALYVVGTKQARRTLGSLRYQAAMLVVAAVVALPAAVLVTAGGPGLAPVARGWWWVAALVAVGGTGHLVFTAAQREVSVAASSSILLMEVAAAAVGAAVIYGQAVTVVQVVGMVVVSGAVAVWITRSAPEGAGEAAVSRPAAAGPCVPG